MPQSSIKTKRLTQSRAVVRINPKLDKKLFAYAAVGSAALCVAAIPAEAKIVYTPASIMIQPDSHAALDINNDGIVDFNFYRCFCGAHSSQLYVIPALASNGVRPGPHSSAAAGFFGLPVGPGEKFVNPPSYTPGVFMANAGQYGSSLWSFGPWAGVTNRYLGLKLVVNGTTHYGWARMNVSIRGTVEITGYAYETTPNTKIVEGHTWGPEKVGALTPGDRLVPGSQPQSLGMLARGSDCLALWRRDSDVLADELHQTQA